MSEFDLEKYSAYKDALDAITTKQTNKRISEVDRSQIGIDVDAADVEPAARGAIPDTHKIGLTQEHIENCEILPVAEPFDVALEKFLERKANSVDERKANSIDERKADSVDEREPDSAAEPATAVVAEASEAQPQEKPEQHQNDVTDARAAVAFDKAASEKTKRSAITGLFEWFESAIFAVVVVILMFTFVFRIVGIDGRSMVPTLQNADRVIISNLFYTPKTGDIVVLDTSEDMIFFNGKQYSKPLIKRVIATGGQTVKVEDISEGKQRVLVDGVPLQEDYINFMTVPKSPSQSEITVPEGSVFVMGDNRGESLDSRVFGCISEDSIVGRALFRIFPISEVGTLN